MANPLSFPSLPNVDESDSDDYSSDDGPVVATMRPDQVRRKIRTFLDNGGMKVTEFISTLKVSGPGYYRFMGQSGTKGDGSDTYVQALKFFQKRDRLGIPMPKKPVNRAPLAATDGNKRKRKDIADADAAGGDKPAKKSRGSGSPNVSFDVSHITLYGEEDDEVEVYDTCDEIRKKMSRHLAKPSVTKASFLRDLQLSFKKAPRRLQSAQLDSFRSKKGPDAGNTAAIFYAAYVFFEKLRIKEKKPKSNHREEMESIWAARGGFPIDKIIRGFYICHVDSVPVMDQYGRVTVQRR